MTKPVLNSKSPSPQPSPGVPGEGASAADRQIEPLQTAAPRRYSKGSIALAWAIAAGADALQIGGFAIFSEGALFPFDAALDIAVAVALTVLIGWHIAFIPTILIEALPFADLAPTWTLAVLIATRGKRAKTDVPSIK